MSHDAVAGAQVRIAMIPPATNPQSATIAIGTCT